MAASSSALAAPGSRLFHAWQRLAPLPGGTWLFSRLLGFLVPYTGSIRARVRALEAGYASVELRDRRGIRNHLGSVHAIALANLGEVASGLALLVGLPPAVRGILVGLSVEYVKKARGTLTAEGRAAIPPAVTEPADAEATAVIRDPGGQVVARVAARWRLAPA
jgi:acyl-coenzyme A thioesterase PaaI-like protein